jgi:hypothetical protein
MHFAGGIFTEQAEKAVAFYHENYDLLVYQEMKPE